MALPELMVILQLTLCTMLWAKNVKLADSSSEVRPDSARSRPQRERERVGGGGGMREINKEREREKEKERGRNYKILFHLKFVAKWRGREKERI